MQNRPGEIENGTQTGTRIDGELGERRAGDGVRLARLGLVGAQSGPRRVERLPHRRDGGGASKASDSEHCRFRLEDIVHRRQPA